MVASPRWRLILVASLTLIVAGIVLLIMSLLTPPVSPAPDAAGGSLVTHGSGEPGEIVVQGVAVHSGPGVATLAAELQPVTGPSVILAVDVPPEATPTRAVPPGAVAQDL